MVRITFFLLLLSCFCNLSSQSIQPDRPDRTESTSIIPANFLQIETGFFYEKQDQNAVNLSHPSVTWRYGVNENFEIRMVTEFNSRKDNTLRTSGFAPLAFGLKVRLVEEKKIIPNISLLGNWSANNIGSREFRTTHTDTDVKLLFQHNISDKISLGYNLGLDWDGESPDEIGVYSVSTSYSFTEKLSSFVEVYGFLYKHSEADHRIDTGCSYLINNNLMLDFSTGIGLSSVSPKYFVSGGFSYRFSLKK